MPAPLDVTQPCSIPYTMPPLILKDIHSILHLQLDTIEYVQLSNDQPIIYSMVTEMQYSFASKQDLD